MSSITKFDLLWTDYLEGEIEDSQLKELREYLNDPLLLETAVEQFQLHRLLNLQAQSSPETQRKFVDATMAALPVSSEGLLRRIQQNILVESNGDTIPTNRKPANQWRWILSLVAAICIAAWCWPSSKTPSNTIEITAMEGTISLTSLQSPSSIPAEPGTQFSSGTLELKTPDSWCELKFNDQSITTISGPARVLLTEGKQKTIRLERGRLSADVTPQPQQLPLLLLTEAADLEVPGNQFNVEAESDGTRLVVNHGTVRIKRKLDGQIADVPANHSIAASFDTRDAMTVFQRSESVSSWQANLSADARSGLVIAESEQLKKALALAVKKGKLSKAEALEKFKNEVTLEEDVSVWGSHTPYGNLVMLSVASPDANPVSISADAHFRITGRLSSTAPLTVGFNTHHPHAGFSGKHFLKINPSELKQAEHLNSSEGQDSMRSFVLELPLNRFLEQSQNGKGFIGHELSAWWCLTEGKNKLQILNVELIDSQTRNPVLPNSL